MPTDRVARRVVMPGIHYEPNTRGHQFTTWDIAPPTKPVPDNCPDLTGQRKGRMRIVGYLGRQKTAKTSRWLARCDCGRFEPRRGDNWRKADNNWADLPDMCSICMHVEKVKVRHRRWLNGENPDYHKY
jgi:hypothetical protein